MVNAVWRVATSVRILSDAPHAAIGFVEAHGLALIIGVLLWRAPPQRVWHLTATAVHVLLGTANLAFWQLFVASDMLMVGYVTTVLHGLFAILQLVAAMSATSASRDYTGSALRPMTH